MLKVGCTGFIAYDPEGYDWDDSDFERFGLCQDSTSWFAFDAQIIAVALEAENISTYENWSEYDAGSRFDGDIDTARKIKKVLEEVKEQYGGFDIYYEEADLNCQLDASAIAQQWYVADVIHLESGELDVAMRLIEAKEVLINLTVENNHEIRCWITPANISGGGLDEMIEYAIKNKFPQIPSVLVGQWNYVGDDCIVATVLLEDETFNYRRLSLAHEVAQKCGLTVIVP